MKIAVAGKGGVGKTTLAAALVRLRVARGNRVIAVDADPAGNLPSALGIPPGKGPAPIAGMKDLVRERTGARDDGGGLMFTLNPQVDDLPDKYSVDAGGARLLVLGTVERGGKGCMCAESAVLKALMQHLFLRVPDDVILDMEAGLEHMGRASSGGVDAMIAVVEPGLRSVETARRVRALAADIGIRRVFVVANKVHGKSEAAALRAALAGERVLGMLPYSDAVAKADLKGRTASVRDREFDAAAAGIAAALEKELAAPEGGR